MPRPSPRRGGGRWYSRRSPCRINFVYTRIDSERPSRGYRIPFGDPESFRVRREKIHPHIYGAGKQLADLRVRPPSSLGRGGPYSEVCDLRRPPHGTGCLVPAREGDNSDAPLGALRTRQGSDLTRPARGGGRWGGASLTGKRPPHGWGQETRAR